MQSMRQFYQTYYTQKGVHSGLVEGLVGPLEVELTIPGESFSHLVMIGHPHPLQGGTMQNKVVTTVVKACTAQQMASLRFNFRGVGQSGGVYDQGIGESEDMQWLAQQCLDVVPHTALLFAGFSFGSYVAYRAATHLPHDLLLSIAPPFHHYDYTSSAVLPKPWVVLQGEADNVVPLSVVEAFTATHPALHLTCFPETGHFFHGQLPPLKANIERVLSSVKK